MNSGTRGGEPIRSAAVWRLPSRQRQQTEAQEIGRCTDDRTQADHRPLATVAARPNPPFCVGFAAESQDVVRLAKEKRRRKKLPLIVANRVQDALGSDMIEITLLDDAGAHPLPKMDKLDLARRLVREIARRVER